jgi:multidrug efflux pump subunit AcrA (membrane-fusion protein)
MPGRVIQINPDVSDTGDKSTKPQGYRAIVALDTQRLRSPDGTTHPLVAGMQLTAEIREGNRTVLQYLLSPIWEAAHDSARER